MIKHAKQNVRKINIGGEERICLYLSKVAEKFIHEVEELDKKLEESINSEEYDFEYISTILKTMDKINSSYMMMMRIRQDLLGEFTSSLTRKSDF